MKYGHCHYQVFYKYCFYNRSYSEQLLESKIFFHVYSSPIMLQCLYSSPYDEHGLPCILIYVNNHCKRACHMNAQLQVYEE